MPICYKCGNTFPNLFEIEGKIRNLSSRKYCLECSPFGKHNTSPLEFKDSFCLNCGNQLRGKQTKYCCRKCKSTYLSKVSRKKLKQRAVQYKGGKCSICGYNKCIDVLEFHHRDSNKKDFKISKYGTIKWERFKKELDKCDLLCANCHREIHYYMNRNT